MSKLKKSIISIIAVCILAVSATAPAFCYAFSDYSESAASNELLLPPDTIPTMEKNFGYDCKLTYNNAQNWLSAISGVTVNSVAYNRTDNSYSVWNDTDYYVSSSYILIGEQAMTKEPNIVVLSADGFEDMIYEIDKSRTVITIHHHSGGTATCAEQAECEVCGMKYGELDTTHTYGEWEELVPPTCVKEGSEQQVCSICGAVETRSVKATGHTEVIENEKAATCTEEGFTGNRVCSVCGEILEEGVPIPKTGHSYADGKCTECGAAAPSAPDKSDNKTEQSDTNEKDKVIKDNKSVANSERNNEKNAKSSAAKNSEKKSPSTGNDFNCNSAFAIALADAAALLICANLKFAVKNKSESK